jgi:hypothetical protein
VTTEAPSQAVPAGPSVADAVKTAFALGWQMARLYTSSLDSDSDAVDDQDRLPGLSALPEVSLVTLGLAQADVALRTLTAFVGASPALPTTDAARTELAKDPLDRDALRGAILGLHIALMIELTAVDFTLGKAYGLGRALADTCCSASGDASARQQALEHDLDEFRALVLVGWLDDLKTVLPAHSGQAVGDSLERWTRWAKATDLKTLDPEAVNHHRRVLHRSGQRWRAVLSGEKDAKDLLETDDYVGAARSTLKSAGAVARSLAWRLKGPLLLATALIAVGVALMFLNNSTAQVLAGLGTVAGGLGITWRTASASVERVSLELGRPIWEAQLDVVIGSRLTPTPQRSFVTPAPPPSQQGATTSPPEPAVTEAAPAAPVAAAPPVPDPEPPTPAPVAADPAPPVPDPEPPTPAPATADPNPAALAVVDAKPAAPAGTAAPHEAKLPAPRRPARTTGRRPKPPAPPAVDGRPAAAAPQTPEEDRSGGADAP